MSINTSSSAVKCWVFGDDINTDALAPGQYIKSSIEILAAHCLESVNADFAQHVNEGDIIVAGKNFGIGSSREQAAQALLVLGVRGVIAQSFGGIFFRNAINLGLPVFTPSDLSASIDVKTGDEVRLDVGNALLTIQSTGQESALKPLPEFLLNMIEVGGLVKVLEKRFNVSS